MKYLIILVLFFDLDAAAYPIDISIYDKGSISEVVIDYCNKTFKIETKETNPEKIRCDVLNKLQIFKTKGIIDCNIPRC